MVVKEDFILFTECGEDGGECAHKEFVNDDGYEFVVCDNCVLALFMEEYGDNMFSFARYCFLVVTL